MSKKFSLDKFGMIKRIKSMCRNKILNIIKEANIEQNRVLCESINGSIGEVRNQVEQNRVLCESINGSIGEVRNQVEQNRVLYNDVNNVLNSLKECAGETMTIISSIFSYCVNEMICKQTDVSNTALYRYYKLLHNLTSWYKIVDDNVEKCRVGRDYDGGYVMLKPFSSTKIAYSFGISGDISWDKDMADMGYQIYQYDHTIDNLPENNAKFHWEKIGLTGSNETDNLKMLNTLLVKNGHENISGMVLKMDIEGAEWDFFNFCDQQILDKFDQIVLELHDLNDLKNTEYKLSGLQKLTTNHIVVNVHGNNYSFANFCGDITTPNVLEITLVKKDKFKHKTVNDIFLENVNVGNNPKIPDILIGKW